MEVMARTNFHQQSRTVLGGRAIAGFTLFSRTGFCSRNYKRCSLTPELSVLTPTTATGGGEAVNVAVSFYFQHRQLSASEKWFSK
jgi:hypothetical protein